MKKAKICIVLCIVLLVLIMGISQTLAAPCGDTNSNGNIDITDALLIAQFYVGGNPQNFDQSAGDVNGDGNVNIQDALLVAQYYVGIIDTLPCQSSNPSEYDLNALIIGRTDSSDPNGPKFAWSASTIKANFNGTGITIGLTSVGDNWINVIIDGQVKTPINVPSGSNGPITLATGLSSGNHTIEIVKRTECWVGEIQFLGFKVENGRLLTPPSASNRKIEFIGDSITCGYGNEGTSQYQSFTNKNENAYLAYGSVTSRLLNAEQITVAWSGKGIIQNYGGDTNETMPVLYDRILPYNADLKWDTSKWIPNVVVINLGTNDYSVTVNNNNFVNTYSQFVNKIRNQYPSAYIYCALGPMLNNQQLESARTNIQSVVSSQNDSKIKFIEFPVQDGSNGYGEDWHPSITTHELMATQLAAQIRKDLGW